MKTVCFVTTFSQQGYALYGRSWINSFSSFLGAQKNVTAKVYVDFALYSPVQNLQVVDFKDKIPEHEEWVNCYNKTFRQQNYNKIMGERFSYKSFVILHALKNTKCDYVVWLDGDCVFISNDFSSFCEDCLGGNFIACQNEGGHIESGVLVFDATHDKLNSFIKSFNENYWDILKRKTLGVPFDGYILYQTLINNNLPFTDLNLNYGLGKIQSTPDKTFLNPLLKTRFIHNIGLEGKKRYENWEILAKKDRYLRYISTQKAPKSAEELMYTKEKLIQKRVNRATK